MLIRDDIVIVRPIKTIRGEIIAPPDKSISHRAVILSAIASGKTIISNFLFSDDTFRTLSAIRKLGVSIDIDENSSGLLVEGKGLDGLTATDEINCGNSGTTMRLLTGLLCGQKFNSYLYGDESLNKRPMKRIQEPLSYMGAKIKLEKGHAPIIIEPSKLNSIKYTMNIASAQVKSSILLASLYTSGVTEIEELFPTRNHTEVMLKHFNCNIEYEDNFVRIINPNKLLAKDIFVPGDISSATYFIALALITENSNLIIRNVGVNKSRTHILRLWQKMGGDIRIFNERILNGEDIADIEVKSSDLTGIVIDKKDVSQCIDEIPILAVTAAYAKGETFISGAEELKVKESDRLHYIYMNLKNMKADVKLGDNSIYINGKENLVGSHIDTANDHRIAMAFTVAGLKASGETNISNHECVRISYPDFYKDLYKIIKH